LPPIVAARGTFYRTVRIQVIRRCR